MFKNKNLQLALFLLLSVAFAIAQTSLGTIAGVVTDPSGAVVSGADVTATSTATGESRSTKTNANGAYRLDSLTPGEYTVTMTASGFSTRKTSKVPVKASLVSSLSGQLTVGNTETVTVEGTGTEIQTENGELSHSISSQEVKEIPIQGLNPIALVLTEPGVTPPAGRDDFTEGIGFSVNGARPRSNNFLIEGQDNNDQAITGQAVQSQNLEAIGEVTILTNSYSAEFGRGGGSVTNVIYKSGTNTWHGSAWDLLQNSALDSNTPANERKSPVGVKPSYRENVFGWSLGGPIAKNKLFAFGSAQWDKFKGETTGSTIRIPTANGFAVLNNAAGSSPNAALLVKSLGSLRATDTTTLRNIDLGSGRGLVETALFSRQREPQLSNGLEWNGKVDWLATSRDNIGFRYVHSTSDLSPDFFNFANTLPVYDAFQGGGSHNAGVNWTHTFSPRLINEARASYGRIGFTFGIKGSDPVTLLPAIAFSGGTNITGFGTNTGLPQGRFHNTYQLQDGVTFVSGSHTWKFGFDIAQLRVRDAIPFNSRGSITYAAGGGFTALGNYIDNFTGPKGSATRTIGNPVIHPQYPQQGYYFTDTWKARTNFTLTYGLRYEYSGTPGNSMPFPAVDINAEPSTTFPTVVKQKGDNNNFAPRVSFAYTPKWGTAIFGEDKTVIRAGYGMFYDSLFTNIIDNAAAGAPNAATGLFTAPNSGRGLANATGLISSATSTLTPKNSVTSMDSNIKNPIIHQWNLDVERSLPWQLTATAAYVGTRGTHLYVNDELNPGAGDFVNRINAKRGSILVRDNAGDSIYHGLNTKLDRRFSKGLFVRAAYTYGRLIDTGSEVFTTSGASTRPEDIRRGFRASDRGLSAFNISHRFVATYLYEIPSWKNTSNFGAAALSYLERDWQISGTTAFQTGSPETVGVGFDLDGDLSPQDRPNLSNPSAPVGSFAYDNDSTWGFNMPAGTLCDGQTFNQSSTCVPTTAKAVQYIAIGCPGCGFAAGNPALGLGNVRRNSIVTRGRQDWTFALARSIKGWHEGHELQFKTELFNPFNHSNTGIPTFLLANSVPTTPTAVNTFGNYDVTRAGQRQIRFWLKYQF